LTALTKELQALQLAEELRDTLGKKPALTEIGKKASQLKI
jgi:hypothetical protein